LIYKIEERLTSLQR